MKIIILRRMALLLILAALIFSVGCLVGRLSLETIPTSGFLAKEMPIFYIQKKTAEVCLTFDISWGQETLPKVLKVLSSYQVPATFFLSGPWATKHPEAVKAITDSGHEIASHGDRHLNLSQYPKEVVRENVAKAHQDLLSVTEKVVPFFRPPNGDYDDLVIDTAREQGYETVIWAIDSLDWKNPGPDYMIERVLSRAFNGAIILCHASDSSKQIHLALPGIIEGLRAQKYKIVTLSQLAANAKPARNDPR